MIETITADYGRLDVLVNNAGGGPPVAAATASPSLTQKIIALNLVAPMVLSQQAHAALAAGEQPGVIINIASVSGVRPSPGSAAYGAAKAGIWGFHNCLWQEGKKHNIRSFVLAPVAHTRLTEDLPGFQAEAMKQRMEPGLVSPLVVYLASDLAKEYTGKTFFVGGGRIAEMRMVRAEGATKSGGGGLWTPREISDRIGEILLP